METTREETAINIAIINKESKLMAVACRLKDDEEMIRAFMTRTDFPALADSIMEYIRTDPDPLLFEQLLMLPDTTLMHDFLRTKCRSGAYYKYKERVEAIERLTEFGEEMSRKNLAGFKNLTPFFANVEAQELLQRAVDGGFLNQDYTPRESTRRFQLKLIAMCIIEILGYKHGDTWCRFEELWGVRIAAWAIPLTKGTAINKVALLYPEVNLLGLIMPKSSPVTLRTDLTEAQVRKLFKGLIHYGYLGPRTPVESFLVIIGKGDYPFRPLNWIAETQDSLVYFAKKVFGRTPHLLRKMCDCFTVNGRQLNHETLKNKSSKMERNLYRFDFVPVIDQIIASAIK